ncbi:hypothetical protein B5F41_12125 [Gordonibacter sp. An232A]|nr:hypothetical protein B5F41_12125 [Gordonibacter sp. An232A]
MAGAGRAAALPLAFRLFERFDKAVRLVAGSVLVGAFGCWHSAAQRSAARGSCSLPALLRKGMPPAFRFALSAERAGGEAAASASAARPREGRWLRAL